MVLRFLISATFAYFCVVLLIQEGKELNIGEEGTPNDVLKIFSEADVEKLNMSILDLKKRNETERFLKSMQVFTEERRLYDESFRSANLELLFCLPLREVFGNSDQLHLDEISAGLVDYFSRSFERTFNDLQIAANSSEADREQLAKKRKQSDILGPLKSRSYYLVRNRFCLILNSFYIPKILLSEMFNDSSSTDNSPYYWLVKDTYDFIRYRPGRDLKLIIISNEGDPNFNCSGIQWTKFECLNDCWKSSARLSKYFYRGNESGVVHLDYDSEQPVKPQRKRCFKECERSFCKRSSLTVSDPLTGYNGSILTRTMKAKLLIPTVNYWIQMLGLLLFFCGTCIFKLTFMPIKFFSKNKQLLLIAKVFLSLLCLVAFLILANHLIADYFVERVSPTSRFLSSAENMSLLVCVPVIYALNKYNDEYLHQRNDLRHHFYIRSQYHFMKDLTFSKLEFYTDDAFEKTVNEVFLEVLDKRLPVSWQLLDKVLFKFDSESSLFSRCFQVAIDLSDEPRYRSFLSISKLTVSFKHHLYSLYLLPDGESFQSDSFRHNKIFRYRKTTRTRSDSCTDYRAEFEAGRSKCNSRTNCEDRCVQEQAIRQKQGLSIYSVIDRDWFNRKEWKTLQPDFSIEEHSRIKGECEKMLEEDCTRIFYERDNVHETDFSLYLNVETIKIYYELTSVNTLTPSGWKLAFDLLNVQGEAFPFDSRLS